MRAGIVAVLWIFAGLASAQPVAVPEPLAPWREWVLREQEFRRCPLNADARGAVSADFRCDWPGVLRIEAGDAGADFSQRWTLDIAGWVRLPGSAEHWPQDVRVDGRAAPVIARGAAPTLWLERGSHRVEGRFVWPERPQALAVPAGIGLVELRVDGREIAPVLRNGGQLTLGRGAMAAVEADAIDVRVFRRLADGIPIRLETRLELSVSGQPRELLLGPVLPEGFVATALAGDWPVRLEPDGRLRIQVQPDTATIALFARAAAPVDSVGPPGAGAFWPRQEIWSYAPQPAIRVSVASGPVQVDPERADVPSEWTSLPAFALQSGETLRIDVRSRGLAPDEADRLSLARNLWLDFDGAGWTARDHLSGRMATGWRMAVAAPWRLESAVGEIGGPQPLLVTQAADGEGGAVEWRTPAVDLGAGLRVDTRTRVLPVGGWGRSLDEVATELRLPPGYRLWAASGADKAHGSWVAAWTLLDVFVAAVIALLAWHALGLRGCVAVSLYLLLAYHQQGAPILSLGMLLALHLAVRALPAGRLRQAASLFRNLAFVGLLLVAVPFVAAQLRLALHPQLEFEGIAMRHADAMYGRAAPVRQEVDLPPPPAPPTPAAEAPLARSTADQTLDRIMVTGTRLRAADAMGGYARDTVVQTGRGLPDWAGTHVYRLHWSGPVSAGQDVRLWISPPWLTRTLRVLVVALLAWTLVRVFDLRLPRLTRQAAAVLWLGLSGAGLGLMPAPASAAEFPPERLLDELRTRLVEPPECAPGCARVPAARVSVDGDVIRVELELHAQARVSIPLPNDAEALRWTEVRLDGAAEPPIARDEDGSLRVAVERGVHRLALAFRTDADRVALRFPLRPDRVELQARDWQADGLQAGRLLAGTLTLHRMRAPGPGIASVSTTQRFPAFVSLVRTFRFDTEWSVETQVRRVAPAEGAISLALPTAPGEQVLTPGLHVREGQVTIALAEDEAYARWHGRLDPVAGFELTAPDLSGRAEEWRFLAGPNWHPEFEGVPPSRDPGQDPEDLHVFVFHPLPGETLRVTVAAPMAAPGATHALDRVELATQAGQRASEHQLTLEVRASRGGEHEIRLPAEAELLGVTRDDQALTLRLADGRLSLPLQPGEQAFDVRFRTAAAVGLHTRLPAIALGAPAANIGLELKLPQDRWVWFAYGPRLGPAVLYWGELLVLVLVAYALARSRYTMLKLHQWLLLGIGFSTFSWAALMLVAGWLFALAWRRRRTPEEIGSAFNLVQAGLVLLSAVALWTLVVTIPQGLLGLPDMHVVGYGSSAHHLQWYADLADGPLPAAGAISLPMWVYRVLMLGWALWLAHALIGWARDGFAAWTAGGYWSPRAPKSRGKQDPAKENAKETT